MGNYAHTIGDLLPSQKNEQKKASALVMEAVQ
jgi:hypothetical protein